MRGEADHLLPELPPLRIHHFLVWMAVAAITIAAVRASNGKDYFAVLSNDTPSFLVQFLSDLIASLATTVCGFVLYWRFRVNGFVWEPGQGFLLQQSATLALRMVGSILFGLYFREVVLTGVGTSALSTAPMFMQWFFRWSSDLYSLLNAVVFLFSSLVIAPPSTWRALFSLLTAFAIVDLAWLGLLYRLLPSLSFSGLDRAEMVSNVLGYLPKLVAVIFLIALSWREKRAGISRHWSHWCGVGCFLASAMLAIGSQLWYDFFSDGWTSYPPTSTTP